MYCNINNLRLVTARQSEHVRFSLNSGIRAYFSVCLGLNEWAPGCGFAAWTIALMPALIGPGSVGQASITR